MAEKVILVVGAKGGVGTSTVAVNLSVQMAQLTRKPVALLEYARGFVRILDLAHNACDFVMIDLGFVNAMEWACLLHMAENLLLVAELSALALGMLERYLMAAGSAGIDAVCFQIVINRWRQNDEDFAARRLGVLSQSFLAPLPNDYRQVSEAVSFGTPIAGSSNNLLDARYRKLAIDILSLRSPDPVRSSDSIAPATSLSPPRYASRTRAEHRFHLIYYERNPPRDSGTRTLRDKVTQANSSRTVC